MTLNIVADENIPAVEDAFSCLGHVETINGRGLRREQVAAADILLVRSVTRVDEQLLAGSRVRFVGSATSGLDHVDRAYLERAGIAFAAAPGANANSVVEYVLSAIAATPEVLESLLSGAGRVGIVGYGAIGRLLRQRLDALQIRSCVYDPWLGDAIVPDSVALDEVLASRVITLHPELTDEPPWPSRHLLSETELQRIANGTLLINASRGAVVDNQALSRTLASGAAFTTVLDVWEGEPDIDTRLLDQVALGSAHIAGYSYDGKVRGTAMLLDACSERLGLDPRRPELLAAEEPPLHLSPGLDAAGIIRHLLAQRYDIREDDRRLRQAMQMAPTGRGAAFDELRRDYRKRGELAGTVVVATGLAEETVKLVTALGCRLESGGK